jgi:hypothetical protein
MLSVKQNDSIKRLVISARYVNLKLQGRNAMPARYTTTRATAVEPSRLEREILNLRGASGDREAEVRAMMDQMFALEESPRLHVTSYPACNSGE